MKSWISFVQNKLSFVTTWSLLSTYQIQLLIELFLPNIIFAKYANRNNGNK